MVQLIGPLESALLVSKVRFLPLAQIQLHQLLISCSDISISVCQYIRFLPTWPMGNENWRDRDNIFVCAFNRRNWWDGPICKQYLLPLVPPLAADKYKSKLMRTKYSISLCIRLLNPAVQDYSISLCTKLLNLPVHKFHRSILRDGGEEVNEKITGSSRLLSKVNWAEW